MAAPLLGLADRQELRALAAGAAAAGSAAGAAAAPVVVAVAATNAARSAAGKVADVGQQAGGRRMTAGCVAVGGHRRRAPPNAFFVDLQAVCLIWGLLIMTSTSVTTPTTRLPRRSTRGVILGLSAARCVALGAAVGIVIFAMFSAKMAGLVVSAVLWVPLVISAYVRVRGRILVEWLPVGVHYGARHVAGQTKFRAAVGRPRPAGTMALPGDAARLRFYNDPTSGACMVHDPRLGTLAAVVHVTHPAYLLLSPATQQARISGWGNVIASLAATGSASVIQVLESTIPDPGVGVEGWWQTRGVHDDSWTSRQYDALLANAREGSTTHQTLITVALDMRTARRNIAAQGRGIKGAAAVLRGDMAIAGALLALRGAASRTMARRGRPGGGGPQRLRPRRRRAARFARRGCFDRGAGGGRRGVGSPPPRLGVLRFPVGRAVAPHRAALRLPPLADLRPRPRRPRRPQDAVAHHLPSQRWTRPKLRFNGR